MPPTKVVPRSAPFHLTIDDDTNLLPVTTNAKLPLPAVIDDGASELIAGTGLLTTKPAAADVPPPWPDVTTVTESVPADARSEARTG